MSPDDLAGLAGLADLAEARFTMDAARLAELVRQDRDLVAELSRLATPAAGDIGAIPPRALADWERYALNRTLAIQGARAMLAVRIEEARSVAARSHGRWLVVRELAAPAASSAASGTGNQLS